MSKEDELDSAEDDADLLSDTDSSPWDHPFTPPTYYRDLMPTSKGCTVPLVAGCVLLLVAGLSQHSPAAGIVVAALSVFFLIFLLIPLVLRIQARRQGHQNAPDAANPAGNQSPR